MTAMTDAQANAVFDVLVQHAGAREWMRDQFVYLHVNGRCDEFRFQGRLGFGGKFWRHRYEVSAYPEDLTPERRRVIDETSAALAALKEGAES